MKITLFGQFGSGNSGNDGSLESMLISLRKMRPDAKLLCICSNPEVVASRFRIPAMSVGGHVFKHPTAKALNRALANIPRRLALVYTALCQLGGVDLMIVPGTGILDDFQERAFGWPFVIFCWCLAARLRRTEILFVSAGAGPFTGRLSRWFLGAAATMASYRSYRDAYSLEELRRIGVDVSADLRFPDIAFNLPTPEPGGKESSEGRCVGLGVMSYRGWRSGDPAGDQIYSAYLAKLVELAVWLVARGYRIRIFRGDTTDEKAVKDLGAALSLTLSPEDAPRVTVSSAGSLTELMRDFAAVDIAVVSRYHNLVCALKTGRAVVSLGYAEKNDELMRAFGQGAFCRHIERFDPGEISEMILQLYDRLPVVAERIAEVNREIATQLQEQEALLQARFLSPRVSESMIQELGPPEPQDNPVLPQEG